MTTNVATQHNKLRIYTILWGYPVVLFLAGVLLNLFLFDIYPYLISLPSKECIHAVVIASVLLTINHTWIMTATEIVRAKFRIHSSPEEWIKSGNNKNEVAEEGVIELKRHHDTHLNTTENTIYFVLLAIPFILVSPPVQAATVWLTGFALGRLGYTYGFLYGKDGVRGFFMSISLLAMYGMAAYLLISLFQHDLLK